MCDSLDKKVRAVVEMAPAADCDARTAGIDLYQAKAVKYAKYPKEVGLAYCALGLNGEAGEVAEKVKKIYRDCGGVVDDVARVAIAKELGDVAWYLSSTASELGIPLSDILDMNIAKLESRYQRGVIGGNGDER